MSVRIPNREIVVVPTLLNKTNTLVNYCSRLQRLLEQRYSIYFLNENTTNKQLLPLMESNERHPWTPTTPEQSRVRCQPFKKDWVQSFLEGLNLHRCIIIRSKLHMLLTSIADLSYLTHDSLIPSSKLETSSYLIPSHSLGLQGFNRQHGF